MTAPAEPTAPATGATATEPSTANAPAESIDYEALYKAEQVRAEELEGKVDAQRRINRQIEQRYKNAQQAGQGQPAGQQQPAAPAGDEAAKFKAEADAARFEAHILRLARAHSAEAMDLLDSVAFREAVDKIEFEDFDELEKKFRTLVDKKLPKKPAAQSTSGGEFTGGTGAVQPITEAQLKTMTKAQIADAYEKGQLKHLLT